MAFSRNLPLLPAALTVLGFLFVGDWAHGCDGDQYWPEPRRVKTWILRATVKFTAPNAVVSEEFLRQVLSEGQLAPCAILEKDLVGQEVQVEKALRSNAFKSPPTGGWVTVPVFNQLMVRLLTRSPGQGVIEILSRTKLKRGNSLVEAVDPPDNAAAVAAAQRVSDQIEQKFDKLRRIP
jgi:hypothetical protein